MKPINEYDSGLLFCPICDANNMGEFRKWISRIQINNNKKLIETFILYESTSSCLFCCLFNFDEGILKYENVIEEQEHTEVRDIKSQENVKIVSNILKDDDDNNCHKCFCNCFTIIIGLLFVLICYPLIGLWFDFCNYCCSIKKNINIYVVMLKIIKLLQRTNIFVVIIYGNMLTE